MSNRFQPSTLLRQALIGDAIASGGTGLLMAAGSGVLPEWLGLPHGLLLGAGLFLLPYAGFVAFLGTRPLLTRAIVWLVIVMNGLWAVESLALLLGGWLAPTRLGTAFVVMQALVVLAFAQLQYIGLRRASLSAGART